MIPLIEHSHGLVKPCSEKKRMKADPLLKIIGGVLMALAIGISSWAIARVQDHDVAIATHTQSIKGLETQIIDMKILIKEGFQDIKKDIREKR